MKLFYSNQCGRSMIEMLGVLAIVGILSVGGIAGYSKAMRKHKINQLSEEMYVFMNDILMYSRDFQKLLKPNQSGQLINITPFLDHLLPKKWAREGEYIYDNMGNSMLVRVRTDVWEYRPTLSFTLIFAQSDRTTMCMAMYELAKSYADTLYNVNIYRQHADAQRSDHTAWGTAHCSKDRTCLKDATLSEFLNNCETFKDDDKYSSFAYLFLI